MAKSASGVTVLQARSFLGALMNSKLVVAQLESELGWGRVVGADAHETGDREVAGRYLDVLYWIRDCVGVLVEDMEPRFKDMARQRDIEEFVEGATGKSTRRRKKAVLDAPEE